MSLFPEYLLSWPSRLFAFLFTALIGRFPIRVVQRLGRGFGRIGWLLRATERRDACNNLQRLDPSLGQRTRKRIARGCFEQMGETVLEAISLSLKSRDHLGSSPVKGGVTVRGLDDFLAVLEKCRDVGKGVILISGHLGSWELAAALIGRIYPHDCAVFARRYKNPVHQQWVDGVRSRLGSRLVYQDESLLKSIRILQRGGILSLLTDLDIHKMDGIHVPFFGELAHTSTVPARLSLRTGAPLLPFFLIRDRSGYHFEWEPPIRQVEEEADESQMIQQLTVEMTAAIERAIRRHPSQWPWMHQRWHSTPEIVLRRRNRRAHRLVEAEVQEA
ncbi:MAG: lysophospholipid acyltransferase family protein [Planctomycetota bacterium]|nr:lysophospholipid acyltransferase family protein [Planctomycetota bacterium]